MKGFLKLGVLLVTLGVFVVGCSSVPVEEDAAGGDASIDSAGGGNSFSGNDGATTGGFSGGDSFSGSELDNPNSPLSKRIIYFEYDSSVVKDEYTSVVEAHARYLAENPNAQVSIEGHADERGTREYNLGLGERRAAAVQQFLQLLGASPSQMHTVSYGEERPLELGNDEQAWQANRRVELVYPR